MSETLFGAWSIEVQEDIITQPSSRWLPQRFRIIGSDTSDGIYYGSSGVFYGSSVTQQLVSLGNEWNIIIEVGARGRIYGVWNPSSHVKKYAHYTVKEGLVIVFVRDVGLELEDYINQGGLVITCKNLDPELNPLHTPGCPFDFTISEELMIEGDKKKVKSKTRKKR